jgi:hypothetical protein
MLEKKIGYIFIIGGVFFPLRSWDSQVGYGMFKKLPESIWPKHLTFFLRMVPAAYTIGRLYYSVRGKK